MREFSRIKRLPAYVFNITNELKMAARHRGDDIVDLSMGNPDGPTPKHIVDKLIEATQRQDTHGYSVSKGILRLRKAICSWYRRRYGVELDADSEAIVTIGSKEGLAHLMLACLERGDTVLVPNPSYPIHIYGAIIAGADIRSVRMTPGVDFIAGRIRPRNVWICFFLKNLWRSHASTTSWWCTTWRTPTSFLILIEPRRSCRCPARAR